VYGFERLDVHGANVKYRKSRPIQKGEAVLEPNHTHFIFIDDGTVREYGREIAFRASLEHAISCDPSASRCVTQTEELSSASHDSFTPPQKKAGLHCRPSFDSPQDRLFYCVDSVPVVLLVVEGGIRTVQTGRKHCVLKEREGFGESLRSLVYAAVVKNNIPAVFFEGTGRCCDLFAKAVRLYKSLRQRLPSMEDLGR
jgi:hypothetical protein